MRKRDWARRPTIKPRAADETAKVSGAPPLCPEGVPAVELLLSAFVALPEMLVEVVVVVDVVARAENRSLEANVVQELDAGVLGV